jgi:hypothetical protein
MHVRKGEARPSAPGVRKALVVTVQVHPSKYRVCSTVTTDSLLSFSFRRLGWKPDRRRHKMTGYKMSALYAHHLLLNTSTGQATSNGWLVLTGHY